METSPTSRREKDGLEVGSPDEKSRFIVDWEKEEGHHSEGMDEIGRLSEELHRYSRPLPLTPSKRWPRLRRALLQLLSLLFVAFCGWLAGKTSAAKSTFGESNYFEADAAKIGVVGLHAENQEVCNPYEEHGILLVNLTVPSENRWEPIAASERCQPLDFMSMVNNARFGDVAPEIEFARNRTVLLIGDSVDRNSNEDFCHFAGGYHEMIGPDHPMSPPLPKGFETPPANYINPFIGKWTPFWPTYDQSRPFVCHVLHLNLRIVNVFQYGFRPETQYILTHAHYYPPATVEERFDQIAIPLLKSVAEKYGTSPVPDLMSLTPTFWGIARLTHEIDAERDALLQKGAPADKVMKEHDVFEQNMPPDQRQWFQNRYKAALEHVAAGWEQEEEDSQLRKPRILWRSLHKIREYHAMPFNRLQAVDQIGRRVVDQLVAEGRAAEAGAESWLNWHRKVLGVLGWKNDTKDKVLRAQLGRRLKLDEWGALMLGQEHHFKDHIHPAPLPGSYLYGNMLLQQLKMAIDSRKQANSE